MRRILSVALAVVMAVSMALPYDAEAKKRLGGGSSFGRTAPVQRQATPPSTPATPSAQPAAPGAPAAQPGARPATAGAAPAAAAQSRSRWLGPIAGLAAGLGLAALASALGVGEELMSLMLILLAVVAVVFVVRMIMARGRPAQPAGAGANYGGNAPMARQSMEHASPWSSTAESMGDADEVVAPAAAASTQPTEAEVSAFLEGARDQFMQLQAHWDAGRLSEIEKFTTPAVAAVFEQQHRDRLASGEGMSTTRIVQLDLEWFGMSQSTGDRGQSVDEALVRFYGLIRESEEGAAEAFDEVWTLHRDRDGQAGWLVAGITQRAAG